MHTRSSAVRLSFVAALVALPLAAHADPAADLLKRTVAILAPEEYESQITFTAHKANGQVTTFSIQMWKKGSDKTRFKFISPIDDRDMEVLRVGDNMWNYLPNLKRSLRISPKQDFHGGDFSNADVLRVDLVADYTPAIGAATAPDEQLLELTAKNDQVAYAKVKLWVRKKDAMPLREELYGAAGKLLRKLDYLKPKAFGALVRPSECTMKNMLVPARTTEMAWNSLRVTETADDSRFDMAGLGR